jgi:hypothetical protein
MISCTDEVFERWHEIIDDAGLNQHLLCFDHDPLVSVVMTPEIESIEKGVFVHHCIGYLFECRAYTVFRYSYFGFFGPVSHYYVKLHCPRPRIYLKGSSRS